MAVVVVLTLASALTVAMVSSAGAEPPNLSSDAAIHAYLTSIGVNPATAVWQGTTDAPSHKNYAGPGCPGSGWNCKPATTPIVQVTDAAGTNLFACGGLNCVVVQVALSGGQNGGGCLRGDNQSNDQTQVCSITQTNDGSPNSTNAATINQNIQQSSGATQNARQVARIVQENTLGKNIAHIHQVVGQRQDAKSGTTLTQTQEAHQGATVDQTTTQGGNTSNVTQRQDQSQRASKVTVLLNQRQNADTFPTTTLGDPSCDQPGATPYDQDKNQCAEISQTSSLIGGGTLDSDLNQVTNETQSASASPTVTQAQGEGTIFGGQGGTVDHLSSGVATNDADQDISQSQTATGATASLQQTKFTGDPRCCQTQANNPADTSRIDQTTNQFASSPNALQNAHLESHCETTGNCNVTQSATVNGVTTTESCTGSLCEEILVCQTVEGESDCFTTGPSPTISIG